MKQVKLWMFAILVAVVVLLLWIGADGLQGIYLWIAELENSVRGIDGRCTHHCLIAFLLKEKRETVQNEKISGLLYVI